MNGRELTPCELGLKAAARRLIARCGGVEAAALICGKGKSTVSLYGRADSSLFMPADVILKLERDCEEPHVTSWLAKNSAHEPPASQPPDPHATLANLTIEIGDYAERVKSALSKRGPGGEQITWRECEELIAELTDVLRVAETESRNLRHHQAQQRGGEG